MTRGHLTVDHASAFRPYAMVMSPIEAATD